MSPSHARRISLLSRTGTFTISGEEAMTFELYVDGLLGIADMWTKHVDETEYAVFIHKVSCHIFLHALRMRLCDDL